MITPNNAWIQNYLRLKTSTVNTNMLFYHQIILESSQKMCENRAREPCLDGCRTGSNFLPRSYRFGLMLYAPPPHCYFGWNGTYIPICIFDPSHHSPRSSKTKVGRPHKQPALFLPVSQKLIYLLTKILIHMQMDTNNLKDL